MSVRSGSDTLNEELKHLQLLNSGFDALLHTVSKIRSDLRQTAETANASHELLDCWSMIISQDKSVTDYLNDPEWYGASRWKTVQEEVTQDLESERRALEHERARLLKANEEKKTLEAAKARRIRDREARLYGKKR
ncbi:unnamed protein product [Kuraishia capsulata CBS 1993]|uniref:DASH complex subunit DUO1 n=1 Tax=Kuraishia capsulata CBS 1993 TaxID=1382522 RepID=W6MPK3_9ASCO|nr:uncharacterized protein KUCA_T00004245001 [Kuraishia capsulata CBS 1993]CDK28263.1 unnamed protein product [Kuraishia capsulata CBS 1993]